MFEAVSGKLFEKCHILSFDERLNACQEAELIWTGKGTSPHCKILYSYFKSCTCDDCPLRAICAADMQCKCIFRSLSAFILCNKRSEGINDHLILIKNVYYRFPSISITNKKIVHYFKCYFNIQTFLLNLEKSK